jgi:hypothetical protein
MDPDGNYWVYALQDIPAGTPLTVSYTNGDNTNPSHLLARYGFLDESSPATFCKYTIPNDNSVSSELLELGYDPRRMLFYKDSGDVSEEVWDVLLYHKVLGDNDDWQTQQAFYQAHISGDTATKQAIHNQYYGQTVQALLQHVEDFLFLLDRLAEKAVGRDLSVHPRLPLVQRHNKYVRDIFMKVRSNLLQQEQQR